MKGPSRILIGAFAVSLVLWSGGGRTAERPDPAAVGCILIHNPTQLQAIQNDLAGAYCLAKNIDLSSIANFVPIGAFATPFTGKFFGNGHVIRNLTINSVSRDVGLFGTTSSATVQDVGLVNVNVFGQDPAFSVGGLIGNMLGSSTDPSIVRRVFVTGRVTCQAAGDCIAAGIVANTSGFTTITESWSSADVTGENAIGGAVGFFNGTISRTYATGSVTCLADNCRTGGLAGAGNGAVIQSYATGAVTAGASARAGGLIGVTTGTGVTQSFATGSVTGGDNATLGGLIGNAANLTNPVDQTYAAGRVSGGVGATLAGLVASGSAPVTNSFWDTSTSGQATSPSGTGVTTAQLRAALPAGFGRAWDITTTLSYPFLNDFDIDFAAPLATLVVNAQIFTLLPIGQFDASQYITPPSHADEAALAAVFTMIARAIGITENVVKLKDVKIDKFFWNDATQTTTFKGPITLHATLGPLTAIPPAKHLNNANVIGQMKVNRLVILRGTFQNSDGSTATHFMLGTLFTQDPNGKVEAVIAHDPWTRQQIMIDPATKRVVSPADFPLTNFKVNGFQSVTIN